MDRIRKGLSSRRHVFHSPEKSSSSRSTDAQFDRDWGEGTNIVATGSSANRANRELSRAKEGQRALKSQITKLERAKTRNPAKEGLLQQQIDDAKRRLDEIDGIIARGGYPLEYR